MTTPELSDRDERSVAALKILLWLALGALAVVTVTGTLFLIIDPEPDSSAEAALGFTAAISGLVAGAFTIGAFVYAQSKNLWTLAPLWMRVVLWTVVAVGIVITVWNLISQPSAN